MKWNCVYLARRCCWEGNGLDDICPVSNWVGELVNTRCQTRHTADILSLVYFHKNIEKNMKTLNFSRDSFINGGVGVVVGGGDIKTVLGAVGDFFTETTTYQRSTVMPLFRAIKYFLVISLLWMFTCNEKAAIGKCCSWKLAQSNDVIVPPVSIVVSKQVNRGHYLQSVPFCI